MKLNRVKIGSLIEQIYDINSDLKYGEKDVKGMTIYKEIIPTKADTNGTDLRKYIIIKPNEFVYNPRTHGKRIGLGFNDTNKSIIISWNNIGFRIRKDKENEVLPDYLFMNFNRDEWDREACFQSWGSSTEVFSWNSLCDMELDLPDIKIQQKYVDIYKAMIENQKSYEKGLDDLKLACDGYLDILKKTKDLIKIGNYIEKIDIRNNGKQNYKFKGLSMENYFIDSIANEIGVDFSKYKIVYPNEFACVLMKVGRDCRLTIAQNTSDDTYIISPAYYTFKLKSIDPTFFMSYVSRNEFERRAWFSCDTSLRGSLPWEEFCNLKIPKANNKEQRLISELFNIYILRKEMNEKIKLKLKEMCPILIKGSIEEAKLS